MEETIEYWLEPKVIVKRVTCLTCHKEVETELVLFGFAYRVGICPSCGKLAYNGK